MNIRDFKYLVSIAELGHFGKAAQACHVSQPALSGQIRKLEDQLGITLFERTNRKVRITPVGKAVAAHARAILDIVRAIEETAQAYADPFSGQLRVGMIPTIGPYLSPLLLSGVCKHLPDISLQLHEDITDVLEASVRDGKTDAAILATAPQDAQMLELPLYDEPFCVALGANHPLARQKTVDVSDIGDEEFLLLADGHCLRNQVLSFCSRVLRNPPVVNTQRTSLATILALVGAGTGVTLAPAMTAGNDVANSMGIVLRQERSGEAMRHVRLVFRKSFPRRAVMEALADLIRTSLSDKVSPTVSVSDTTGTAKQLRKANR